MGMADFQCGENHHKANRNLGSLLVNQSILTFDPCLCEAKYGTLSHFLVFHLIIQPQIGMEKSLVCLPRKSWNLAENSVGTPAIEFIM